MEKGILRTKDTADVKKVNTLVRSGWRLVGVSESFGKHEFLLIKDEDAPAVRQHHRGDESVTNV